VDCTRSTRDRDEPRGDGGPIRPCPSFERHAPMTTSFWQRCLRRVRGPAALVLVAQMVVGGMVLAGALVAHAPTASAANTIAINPASGGSHTSFGLNLPTGAKCAIPTNQVGGDFVDTFVVSDAKVPAAQLANLTFSGNPALPHATGYTGT